MLTNSSQLKDTLKEAGIQPSVFAFFIIQFCEKKEARKSIIASLLDDQLKVQAEMILYHLTH